MAVEVPVANTRVVDPLDLTAWVAWARGRVNMSVVVVPTTVYARVAPAPKPGLYCGQWRGVEGEGFIHGSQGGHAVGMWRASCARG
jgi:hypothetical protein